MNDILQADIFFFIASVATVIFLLLLAVILFQVYKIIKLVRTLLERIESASEVVAEDAAHIRQLIAGGGIIASIMSLMKGRGRRSRSKASEEED